MAEIEQRERIPRPASPIEWWALGDEIRGGPYRIRLVAAHRWEISRSGVVVAEERTRSASFHRAETHLRQHQRRTDVVVWSIVLVLGIAAMGALAEWVKSATIWWVSMLGLALFVVVSAVVRLGAALTGSRNDPYRRLMPWERRARWWHRWTRKR